VIVKRAQQGKRGKRQENRVAGKNCCWQRWLIGPKQKLHSSLLTIIPGPHIYLCPLCVLVNFTKNEKKKKRKPKKIEVSYLWAIILFVFVVAITQTT